MAEPYIKKNPNDIIRAQDWNDIQGMARDDLHAHDHSGGDKGPRLTGAGIDPQTKLSIASAEIATSLTVNARDILAEIDKLIAGIGTKLDSTGGTVTGALTVKGEIGAAGGVRLSDQTVFLRSDANHALSWRASFAGQKIDGPALYGFSGGAVGTSQNGEKIALSWDTNGQVQVGGAIVAGNSDLYFNNATHKHTGRGNTEGWAAIENDSADYKALMILGRWVGGTRQVKLWDRLEIAGTLKVGNQEAWVTAELQHGWSNYGNTFNPAGYYKDSLGIVHLRGLVRGGQNNVPIFVLPEGYRPENRELKAAMTYFPGQAQFSDNRAGRCDVLTDGQVLPMMSDSSWFSLDNISFRAAR